MYRNVLRFNTFYQIIHLLCSVILVENQGIIYHNIWDENMSDEGTYLRLIRPIKYIVIDDLTMKGFSCYTSSECTEVVQRINVDHKIKWNGIGYNFLIGANMTIYEGAGWYKQGYAIDGFNHLCISIAYIDGDSIGDKLDNLHQLSLLIDIGTELYFLKPTFKALIRPQIVTNNDETKNRRFIDEYINTSEIYKFISRSTHWYNGTVYSRTIRVHTITIWLSRIKK